jgi:hypothetical protein
MSLRNKLRMQAERDPHARSVPDDTICPCPGKRRCRDREHVALATGDLGNELRGIRKEVDVAVKVDHKTPSD